MKKVICIICLMAILLIAGCTGSADKKIISGCKQQNQKQSEYRLEKTEYGYIVILPQENYTFVNDIKVVLQEKQFTTHVVFWSAICVYPFFLVPFTDAVPMIFPQELMGGI